MEQDVGAGHAVGLPCGAVPAGVATALSDTPQEDRGPPVASPNLSCHVCNSVPLFSGSGGTPQAP